jgi:quinol monooxygenase YgiN
VAWPDTFDALLEGSLAHVRRSRAESGCVHHAVSIDAENPLRLVFFEKWESMEALKAHFQVPASNAFVREAAALSEHWETMEIWTAELRAPRERQGRGPPGLEGPARGA